MNSHKLSFIFTFLAMIAAYFLGGIPAVLIVGVLGILEVSLSFDNAVVNASVLEHWDDVWRQRFLTWGMLIAVFGMRLIFPLLIVAVTASMGPIETLKLALDSPKDYSAVLQSVHHEISAFGGMFLMMVFLKFFIDEAKDEHWISVIEDPLSLLGKVEAIQIVISVVTLLMISSVVKADLQQEFIVAGLWGLVTYVMVDGIGAIIGDDEDSDVSTNIVKQGVAGFLYLELLDMSFSFDGTLSSFSITNNIFIIMLGLGIGAMFVRSMTIHLVETGTLNTYKYLEHSAFWSIGFLSCVMMIDSVYHIHNVVISLVSVILIIAGVIHSIYATRLK
jgi:uncharacterized protein